MKWRVEPVWPCSWVGASGGCYMGASGGCMGASVGFLEASRGCMGASGCFLKVA